MESFNQAWLKRRAQYSTVAFLRSADPKRLDQFVLFIHNIYSSASISMQFRIYLFKPWSGLFSVSVKDGSISYSPVIQSTTSLGSFGSAMPAQPIRELPQALIFLDNEMRKGDARIIAIFWGLAPFKNVTDPEFALLTRFLRNAIFSYDYYAAFHFIVIFTENPELITDEDTLRRSIVVNVEPSTLEEREKLLRDIAEKLGLSIEDREVRMLAEAMRGLTLHEVESVALESIFRHQKYDMAAMTAFKYDIVRKQGLLDVEEPTHGFEAVGGYDALKEFVISNVIKVFNNPEKAKRLGIDPPRGILLFGPPGTGKTWFARALARELRLPFLRLRGEKIVSMWYGETTRLMAQALRLAEEVAPCVLFIDEIDRFGRRGGIAEHEETRRAFSVLLEWLGDARRRTIVVGTTNRVQDLDEAFIRVGRFDYLIPVLYPDYQARYEILRIHTSVVRRVPLAKTVNLKDVAAATELWSGAELAELVLRAARNALQRDADVVTMEDFEAALSTFRIDLEERRRTLSEYLALAEKYTNDQRFLERLKRTMPPSRVEAVRQF
ncbi:MAG: ATP-binding protein [Thermofilaceae archaeon]